MLRDAFESRVESTPEELRAAYDELLAETITDVGIDTVEEESELDRDTLAALLDGETPAVSLSQAATILAADSDRPDAEAIESEARDILLLGMSMAVLDVEALASGINDQMEPKEIQGKVEGRFPMSLDEYALLHSYIEQRKR